MSADPNRLERRASYRFDVHLPVALHFEGRTVPGFTQNLSGRGLFFYSDAVIREGASVELTFTMPSEVTLGESMPVRCRGRVLRTARAQNNQRNGLAVQFDSYEYLPADEGEPVSQFVRVSVAVNQSNARPVPR
jgi:PilZ domain